MLTRTNYQSVHPTKWYGKGHWTAVQLQWGLVHRGCCGKTLRFSCDCAFGPLEIKWLNLSFRRLAYSAFFSWHGWMNIYLHLRWSRCTDMYGCGEREREREREDFWCEPSEDVRSLEMTFWVGKDPLKFCPPPLCCLLPQHRTKSWRLFGGLNCLYRTHECRHL